MGGFIILAVFAVIGIFISRANKLAKREMSGKSFGENFPFPPRSDAQQDREPFDPWDMSARGDLAPIAAAADELRVDEVVSNEVESTTYRSIDMSLHNADQDQDFDRTVKGDNIEFDLRQAVIYSEILKPKFME